MSNAIDYLESIIKPNRLIVQRVDVPITNLPPVLDGLRIGQLCDLHRWKIVPRTHIEWAVALLAAEKTDIVALTGDFVDHPEYATEYSEILSQLDPWLGKFACLGNHDYCGADDVTTALQAAGVTVLRNQHQLISINGAQLCIIGLEDMGTVGSPIYHLLPRDNLPAALSGVQHSDSIRLLLVHNPDFVMKPVFAQETASCPIHLVLAGHTHGGQIYLPGIGPLFTPSRYRRLFGGGLVQAAGTLVNVSRGAGASWPVRFNCPPEVNVLTLRQA